MAGELKNNVDLILSNFNSCQKNIDSILYNYVPPIPPIEPEEVPYIELEYIQGTGSQYLRTGYIPTINTKVEITLSDIVSLGGNSEPIISGTSVFANGSRFLLCWWNSNNSFAWSGDDSSASVNFGVGMKDSKNTICVELNKVTFNGTQIVNETLSAIQDPAEIYLMYCPVNTTHLSYKLYGFNIYENDVIVHQYIPVQEKATGIICMYDLIDEQFIYNAGTNNFIPSSREIAHIELDFIESTGTQWLDTGIVPTNHITEIKFQFTEATNNAALFGTSSTTYHLTWYSDKWYYACGNTEQNLSATTCTELQTVVFNTYNNDISFNEISYGTTNSGVASTSDNLYIFKRTNAGSAIPCKARVYYVKITDKSTNTLVRDLIPVKLEDGTICFFDNVSRKYFYCSGTDLFLPSPETDVSSDLIDKTNLMCNYIPKNITSNVWLNTELGNHLTGTFNIENNQVIFDGTSTVYTTPITQSNMVNGYTVIFRLKPDTWNNYRGVYGLHDTSGQNGMVGFQYESGNINVAHRYINIGTSVASSLFPIGVWGIYGCVFDGSQLHIYIDGKLVSSSVSGATLKPTGNLIIGKSYNSADRFFDGAMSHIMIYTRALSTTEMSNVATYINANIV